MNLNFSLDISPAIARRILHLKKAFPNTEVSDDIVEIADQNKITDAEFDTMPQNLSETARNAVQELVDLNLRAIVSPKSLREYEQWVHPILIAAKLSGVKNVIIGRDKTNTNDGLRTIRKIAEPYNIKIDDIRWDSDTSEFTRDSLFLLLLPFKSYATAAFNNFERVMIVTNIAATCTLHAKLPSFMELFEAPDKELEHIQLSRDRVRFVRPCLGIVNFVE